MRDIGGVRWWHGARCPSGPLQPRSPHGQCFSPRPLIGWRLRATAPRLACPGRPWHSTSRLQRPDLIIQHARHRPFHGQQRRFRGSQASFYLMLLSRGRKSASLPCGCLCSMPTRRRALNSHHRRQPWASDAVRAGDDQIACTFPFPKAIQSYLWPLQLFVHSQRAFSVLSRRRPAGQRPST